MVNFETMIQKDTTIKARLLIFLLLIVATLGSGASAQTSYEEAVAALASGETDISEAWYQSLSKKERKQPLNLILAARSAIISYDTPLAEERIAQLNKLRLKQEEEIAAKENLLAYYQEVMRMLGNTREVDLIDTLTTDETSIYTILGKGIAHLGSVTQTSYTTPNGEVRWEVGESNDEAPHWLLTHQLSDGSYDRENAQKVAVRGLDPKGKLSHPFLSEDGQTLYFAYSGAGTMGGSDLYVTRYNRTDHTLLIPQKLSLPFNSPHDDLFYIVDEGNDLIWLGRKRALSTDSVQLYLIRNSSSKPITEAIDTIAMAKLTIASSDPGRLIRIINAEAPRGTQTRSKRAPLFFTMQGKEIRSSDDLPTQAARHLFQRYLTLWERIGGDKQRLAELRRKLSATGEKREEREEREKEVLSLEAHLESQEVVLKALRNEIITASGLN